MEVNISAQPNGGLKETKMHQITETDRNMVFYNDAGTAVHALNVSVGVSK
jgi:hypothetical protein